MAQLEVFSTFCVDGIPVGVSVMTRSRCIVMIALRYELFSPVLRHGCFNNDSISQKVGIFALRGQNEQESHHPYNLNTSELLQLMPETFRICKLRSKNSYPCLSVDN